MIHIQTLNLMMHYYRIAEMGLDLNDTVLYPYTFWILSQSERMAV